NISEKKGIRRTVKYYQIRNDSQTQKIDHAGSCQIITINHTIMLSVDNMDGQENVCKALISVLKENIKCFGIFAINLATTL
ncbi:hypothetical protein L9F63_018373, partial [Diploptera punctata]